MGGERIVVIPYVPEKLRPEVREVGERLNARLALMHYPTSYWDLFVELWAGQSDFISIEEDVLVTPELIEAMQTCDHEWCSGTYGRWWWEQLCAPTWPKWCSEPPGRCGESSMTEEKLARLRACPHRAAGRTVLRSDSWLGCVRFGSIRRRFPDLLERAAKHYPGREWQNLDHAMRRVLYDEELLSPHLHFPHMRHLKEGGPHYDDPWGPEQYEADPGHPPKTLLATSGEAPRELSRPSRWEREFACPALPRESATGLS